MRLFGKKKKEWNYPVEKKSFFSVWNIRTGERLHMLSGHTAAVRCVCYNGKYVVSGAYDHTIRVWLPDQEKCVHTLEGHTNRVYSLVVCLKKALRF
jgi:WD40 repeat protein